ncbi:MAG: hypothetical protein ACLPHP_20470 [Candidatus Sulfotelmatobacter sp.]
MKLSDTIRAHGREKYVLPAREKRVERFSIRAGDVVKEMGISTSRVPAVCSALKTHQFLRENELRLVQATGPKSGQTTTVTYTYEFANSGAGAQSEDAWSKLRGALKDVFAELGGGEAYLRAERNNFFGPESSK